MSERDELSDPNTDLKKEQDILLALMESSISPDLLKAVLRAYHGQDDVVDHHTMDISYEGTTCA